MSRHSIRIAVNVKSWLPTETEWLLASRCVQKEEKDRIGKFVFQRDAKSSMVGRLLMRKVLSDMTGCQYCDIQLGRTNKGKPYLENDASIEFHGSFNIAHHGDYTVIAADTDKSVGIDVMQVEHRKDMKKLFSNLHRQLTDQEWRTVEGQSSDRDKMAMFYRFWCLKESYVKALGTGIGFEVGRLDFDVPTPLLSMNHIVMDTSLHVDGTLQSDWLFEETLLDEDHCVAVATNRSIETEVSQPTPFQFLSVQDLLSYCQPLSDTQPDLEYWKVFNSRQETPKARQS